MKFSFASRASKLLSSHLHKVNKEERQNSFISLAEELPAEEFFPIKRLGEAARMVLSSDPAVLQYGDPQGYAPLRSWISEDWKLRRGMQTTADQILLTAGTQQAIDLITRLLVDIGDSVVVENPTSPGCLQVLEMQGANIIAVENDLEGLLPDRLEEQFQSVKPKLLFAAPSFSNPTGILWSLERRKAVLELCRKYEVLIVEDDSYGELHFGSEEADSHFSVSYPTLYALDARDGGNQVLYIGSFSKTIAPAMRTGWAVGDQRLIRGMSTLKQMADWQSSSLNQQILYFLLHESSFRWKEHLALLNREYEVRLKLVLELLKRPGFKEVKYHPPSGGMYLWIQLPHGLHSEALLRASMRLGVAFLPGSRCSPGRQADEYIRINFSRPGREELLLGMNLISEAIQEFTARR
ncbi:PLP-dependent aminotransferase family protein [Paenibacillus polygoni]|uniref:PLP-dependent aminotransferase family protein n=1 Tax=Paenibacillus polygoni TaxID=3050112 RepID=A0ABY8X7T0_9BACL|nr:PLP-dependent aminotransferase family protein [Paenibacillus polygoni]WIV20502.1 PLP-dependent aminotransferase family protein [Paenibacillus polygoni]